VSDEKYTAQSVAPVLTSMEFTNPTIGSNVLPCSISQLLSKNLEGTRPMEFCCISKVLRVAFMNMTQKGNMLKTDKNMQTM
jgi:hypothetical protein